MQIELNEQEVQTLVNILANSTGVPWAVTHPLIMKIGAQQQAQQQVAQSVQAFSGKGNSHGDPADLDQERGAAGSVGPARGDTSTPGS